MEDDWAITAKLDAPAREQFWRVEAPSARLGPMTDTTADNAHEVDEVDEEDGYETCRRGPSLPVLMFLVLAFMALRRP